jgi:hypothetical protein
VITRSKNEEHTMLLIDKAHAHELIRPWKLLTLVAGLGLLIYGSAIHRFSDWDVGVSVLMGVLTYIVSPWSSATINYGW